jgi:hypothetical protein
MSKSFIILKPRLCGFRVLKSLFDLMDSKELFEIAGLLKNMKLDDFISKLKQK